MAPALGAVFYAGAIRGEASLLRPATFGCKSITPDLAALFSFAQFSEINL
jgi:hypothetical protein